MTQPGADQPDPPAEPDVPAEPAQPDQPAEPDVPAEPAEPDQPAEPVGALGERERDMLAFERQWWRHAGAKDQAIRDQFGLSPTRYYQLLNVLLDDPAALAADPVLVKRLRRLRASGRRARGGPS